MGNRLELHELLCAILGSRNVYYQPPESIKMKYPAIVYSRNSIDNDFADNLVYRQSFNYIITVLDENPDSEIVAQVSKLPTCRYNRNFKSDNLNHDVFTFSAILLKKEK